MAITRERVGTLHAGPPRIASAWLLVVTGLVYALGRGLLRRRRAELQVERIFELSLDMLCVVDEDGYFMRVNPAFERTLGFTTAEILARPFMEFVHPDDRAATERAFAAVLGGETVTQFENRYLRADGSFCWLQWSTRPAPDEGRGYATARDVTESRRTQDELRNAQRLVQASRDELRILADEQASLRRVATLVARGEPPERIFDALVVEVGRLLGADSAGVQRYEPDGTSTLVAAWGDPGHGVPVGARMPAGPGTLLGDVRLERRALRRESSGAGTDPGLAVRLGDMGLRTIVAAPVVVEDRVWGLIATAWRGDPAVPLETEDRIAQFTELVATAIANAEGRAELAASRARIVAASDAARRRIERDLHDGAQQRLVSLALGLRGAEGALGPEHEWVRAQLQQTADGLDQVLDDLQEMSRGIHPAILSKGGLGPALRTLARRSAVPVELDVDAGCRLPEPVEVAAYYVVSEALANAGKHAQASVVHIDVEDQDGFLSLVVEDDGVGGVDPAQGSGLTGLRDRVEALGGRFEVVSGPGRGTALHARIPVDPPALH